MNIQVLFDLQKNLYNTVIAGVNLIDEDFRLKKAIEQFETISNAAPVFQKIDAKLKSLDSAENKSATLLECITLVDAVCKTQASFQIEKPTTEIETFGTENIKHTTYSRYIPIHDALTHTGGGRYEIISVNWQTTKQIFNDYRLQNDLIYALGDKYSELADLCIRILSSGNFSNIIPRLKSDLDIKGKKDMARRVTVISNIAKEKENDYYIYLVQNANATVRESAISALQYDENNVDFLIELTKTQKGECKKTALETLGTFNTEKSNEFWKEYLKKHNTSDDIKYLYKNGSIKISDIIALKISSMIDEVKKETNKDKLSTAIENIVGMIGRCFRKTSAEMINCFYKIIENYEFFKSNYSYPVFTPLNNVIIMTMLDTHNEEYIRSIMDIFHTYPNFFICSGLTAYLILEPEKSYEIFSKFGDSEEEWQDVLSVFNNIKYNNEKNIYEYSIYSNYSQYIQITTPLFETLDPNWVKALTTKEKPFHILGNNAKTKEISFRIHTNMIKGLINKNDEESKKYFKNYFSTLLTTNILRTSVDRYMPHITESISALMKLGETDFKGIGIDYVNGAILKRCVGTDLHMVYVIYSIIPMSKEDKVAELEIIYSKLEKYLETTGASSRFNEISLKNFKEHLVAFEADNPSSFSQNYSYLSH